MSYGMRLVERAAAEREAFELAIEKDIEHLFTMAGLSRASMRRVLKKMLDEMDPDVLIPRR